MKSSADNYPTSLAEPPSLLIIYYGTTGGVLHPVLAYNSVNDL